MDREVPSGLLSEKDASVSKKPSPATGSISNTSLLTMTGLAATQPDPMRGRIVQEGTPEAQRMIAAQQRQIAEARAAYNLSTGANLGTQRSVLASGQRVYHTERQEAGVIAKASDDGVMIEVIFSHGKRRRVNISKLQKI